MYFRNSPSGNPSQTKISFSTVVLANALRQQRNSRVSAVSKTCGITGGVGWIGRGGVKARMMRRIRSSVMQEDVVYVELVCTRGPRRT